MSQPLHRFHVASPRNHAFRPRCASLQRDPHHIDHDRDAKPKPRAAHGLRCAPPYHEEQHDGPAQKAQQQDSSLQAYVGPPRNRAVRSAMKIDSYVSVVARNFDALCRASTALN